MDKERQELSDELDKIRTDFRQYQRETEEQMKSSHHNNDTVRSLMNQIKCLKEELNDGEIMRQQLIQENNELQKQISHENIVIPQLESELKSLTQENDYLKLLGKFLKRC